MAVKTSRGLKALKRINSAKPLHFSPLYDLDNWNEDIAIIEKELKLLVEYRQFVRDML